MALYDGLCRSFSFQAALERSCKLWLTQHPELDWAWCSHWHSCRCPCPKGSLCSFQHVCWCSLLHRSTSKGSRNRVQINNMQFFTFGIGVEGVNSSPEEFIWQMWMVSVSWHSAAFWNSGSAPGIHLTHGQGQNTGAKHRYFSQGHYFRDAVYLFVL